MHQFSNHSISLVQQRDNELLTYALSRWQVVQHTPIVIGIIRNLATTDFYRIFQEELRIETLDVRRNMTNLYALIT